MANRKRNYAAEYQARIARGEARGFSRSQAAGHPKQDEPKISEVRSTWRRVLDWFTRKPERKREPKPGFDGGKRPPPPPPPPSEPTGDYGDPWERVPPGESGIPPEENEYQSAYDNLLSDLGIGDDPFAADLLWTGWFDLNVDSDRRASAREAFFIYTGLGSYEFDWDSWRDWYSEVSA